MKGRLLTLALASLVFNAILLLGAYSMIIDRPSQGLFFSATKLLPMSAGSVGEVDLPYYDHGVLAAYYERQGFDDAKVRAGEKMAAAIRLRAFAEDIGFEVDGAEVQQRVDELAEEMDAEVARKWLAEPYVMEKQLREAVYSDDTAQVGIAKKLETIKDQYEEGVPFSDLAVQYSSDNSAIIGGELGAATNARIEALEIEGIEEDELFVLEEEQAIYIFELYAKYETVIVYPVVDPADPLDDSDAAESTDSSEDAYAGIELDTEEVFAGDFIRMIELKKESLAEILKTYQASYPLELK